MARFQDHNLLKAKCLIAVGEAYKEKAMITKDKELYTNLYNKARQYCEDAIKVLDPIKHQDVRYLIGTAKRHLAVTYELEGDKQIDNKEIQMNSYKMWQRLSSEAAEILESINEDTVRAYALMNLASSFTRLCEFEVSNWRKKELLKEGKNYLEKSIPLLRCVKDFRGLGWAYNHLCENTCQRLKLSTRLMTTQIYSLN